MSGVKHLTQLNFDRTAITKIVVAFVSPVMLVWQFNYHSNNPLQTGAAHCFSFR
jgi:hypothetical protein